MLGPLNEERSDVRRGIAVVHQYRQRSKVKEEKSERTGRCAIKALGNRPFELNCPMNKELAWQKEGNWAELRKGSSTSPNKHRLTGDREWWTRGSENDCLRKCVFSSPVVRQWLVN